MIKYSNSFSYKKISPNAHRAYKKEIDKRTDGRMDGRLVIQTDGVNCKHDR